MDKGQILMDYRLAKNHKRQIPILADLNACDTQTIVEILEEGGYKRMFNTNGVDISVKKTEIEQKYSSGESIAALAMAYHISKKQIKVLLGVEETEGKEVMETKDQFAISALEKENAELKAQLKECNAENERLMKNISYLEKQIAETKCNMEVASDFSDKYQQLCIKYNQLNTTIDVLVDKIGMLKAVGYRG